MLREEPEELDLKALQNLATGFVVGYQILAIGRQFVNSRKHKKPLPQKFPAKPTMRPRLPAQLRWMARKGRGLAFEQRFKSDVALTRQNLTRYSGIDRILAEAFINSSHHRIKTIRRR